MKQKVIPREMMSYKNLLTKGEICIDCRNKRRVHPFDVMLESVKLAIDWGYGSKEEKAIMRTFLIAHRKYNWWYGTWRAEIRHKKCSKWSRICSFSTNPIQINYRLRRRGIRVEEITQEIFNLQKEEILLLRAEAELTFRTARSFMQAEQVFEQAAIRCSELDFRGIFERAEKTQRKER